ncbi:hypothetical protein HGG76_05680 [Ochrobactrum tritici]|uniref:Uncharacterized protein n=1 Tax=Brucella tritici TaxID=94626 RepID=A0A7X6JCF3_9HYPH|nr:hypothetical protein [Brucella tritici]
MGVSLHGKRDFDAVCGTFINLGLIGDPQRTADYQQDRDNDAGEAVLFNEFRECPDKSISAA